MIFSLSAGRSAAVFAVLAGVGIAFLTGRRRVALGRPAGEAAASLVARALVIGAIGLALGYTDPEIATVILPYYAVLFLIAVPLVLLPTPVLAVLGPAVAVGMPFLSHDLRMSLPVHDAGNHSFVDLVTDPLGMLTELTADRGVPGTSVDGVPVRRDRGRPAAAVVAEGRRLAARRRSRGRSGSGGSVPVAARSDRRLRADPGRGYGMAGRGRRRRSWSSAPTG